MSNRQLCVGLAVITCMLCVCLCVRLHAAHARVCVWCVCMCVFDCVHLHVYLYVLDIAMYK